ncbi:UDP-glucose 4-epimerase GalE [Parvularcula marina]|uniref:UDP-glucose 4-epimerase n=2 Tax=Parvularcula marina TaxID=2292771 RepID=A0A371RGA5_9PROT|nr:UDP-glucose 4-epimerase GalE [Parvularcula marina]
MRVIVTGGAGYIGSHACKALAEAGHEPVALDNFTTGHRWAVKWGPLAEVDLNDRRGVLAAFREYQPDAVMHFAALSIVGDSVNQPDLYYRTNVSGTLNLFEAMTQTGVERFVFSSSCATYGETNEMPLTEASPQMPLNPYGQSKMMVEQMLKDLSAAGDCGATALRYFNAAGADPDGETGEDHDPETHLIPIILQAASGRRSHISVFGSDYDTPDGTCVRDYVHVSDLARAHVAALETTTRGEFRAFNLGTGHGHSVREVIESARRVTGRSFDVREAERRAGDAPLLVADASKAKAELGWSPQFTELDDIVRTAWHWMERDTKAGSAA